MFSINISIRIGCALGVLVLIIIGVGWLGVVALEQSNTSTETILNQQWTQAQIAREAVRYSSLNSRITMTVFLLKDQAEINAMLTRRAENTMKISALLKRLETMADSEFEKRLLEAIKRAREPYIASYLQALQLLKEGKSEPGREIMAKTTLPLLIKYHEAWEEYVKLQGSQMDDAVKANTRQCWIIRREVVALVIAAAALAAAIASFTIRHLNQEMTIRKQAERAIRTARDELEQRVIERTAELAKARDAALESSKLKTEFLSNMSHEIRTPMNGVIGMTSLLRDTELNTHQRKYVETIRQSSESLLKIINDILDFSKIEAGKLVIEAYDFDFRETVETILELVAKEAQTKNLGLAVKLQADVPVRLHGDGSRLRQVLLNLISNAIKFTEQGTVEVRISKAHETETRVRLLIEIIDTGIGISLADQNRLFQSFTQADGSTTRKYGGTGLGLAISKQLVTLLGGEIGVKSIPNQGSTFWFTVTFDKQAIGAVPALAEQPQRVVPSDRNLRILLAEDSKINQDVALGQLRRLGHTADAVSNGLEALEATRQIAYDIVFMDCQMPELDGYEATKKIRQREQETGQSPLCIVAMTAHAMKGDREKCLAAGMNDYLSKPVRMSDFQQLLAKYGLSADPQTNSTNGAMLPTCPSPTGLADKPEVNLSVSGFPQEPEPLVDMKWLNEICGDNPETTRDFAKEYLSHADELMAGIKSAMQDGSADNVKRLTHKLVGSSLTSGFKGAVPALRKLEAQAKEGQLTNADQLIAEIDGQFERVREFVKENLLIEPPTAPRL